MTTCAECLTSISTMRLADITPDSPVALHCATCPDCASVVQETVYAEKRLSDSLAEMRPGMMPETIYAGALEASEKLRREEVARWARWLLGAAAAATLWFFMQTNFIPRLLPARHVVTETITLRCITPDQASDIATPYLRSSGSAIYLAKGLNALTIRGQPQEFAEATAEIRKIDAQATCPLPGTVEPPPAAPATTPTSTGTPKKD